MKKSKVVEYDLKEKLLKIEERAKAEYDLQLKKKKVVEEELQNLYDQINIIDEAHSEIKEENKNNIKKLKEYIKVVSKELALIEEVIAYYEFNFGF